MDGAYATISWPKILSVECVLNQDYSKGKPIRKNYLVIFPWWLAFLKICLTSSFIHILSYFAFLIFISDLLSFFHYLRLPICLYYCLCVFLSVFLSACLPSSFDFYLSFYLLTTLLLLFQSLRAIWDMGRKEFWCWCPFIRTVRTWR